MLSNQTQPSESRDDSTSYHTVIVGAGLAGLTAAVKLSRNGKKVAVVESRDELDYAIRPQLIALSADSRELLLSLCDADIDEVFAKKLNLNSHIAIKDIQHFLKSKIDNANCTFLFNSKITAVDLNEGHLSIRQTKIKAADSDLNENEDEDHSSIPQPTDFEEQNIDVTFDKYLVLAEGHRRETAKLLHPFIEFQPISEKRPEIDHASAYFSVESKDGGPIENFPMENLIELVIDGNHYGYIYFENFDENSEKVKVSIVMNISPERAEKFTHDKLLGIEYLKHCVAAVFNEDEFNIRITKSDKPGLTGQKKDDLKFSVFTLNFIEAKKAAVSHKGRAVVLGGDTKRDTDFYQGHGGNDALQDGIDINLLINEELTIDEYNDSSENHSKDISLGTKRSQPIVETLQTRKHIVSPFLTAVREKLFEEKLVHAIHSPITAQGDAHDQLFKEIAFMLRDHESDFGPFLSELRNKNYSKALQRISVITSEPELAHAVTKAFLDKCKELKVTFDIEEAAKGEYSVFYSSLKENDIKTPSHDLHPLVIPVAMYH